MLYKEEEIRINKQKFVNKSGVVASKNFLCVGSSLLNVDNYFIAYYDYGDKAWYLHENIVEDDCPVKIDVRYFMDHPDVKKINSQIKDIEHNEDPVITKIETEMLELLRRAIGEIDSDIYLKEVISNYVSNLTARLNKGKMKIVWACDDSGEIVFRLSDIGITQEEWDSLTPVMQRSKAQEYLERCFDIIDPAVYVKDIKGWGGDNAAS